VSSVPFPGIVVLVTILGHTCILLGHVILQGTEYLCYVMSYYTMFCRICSTVFALASNPIFFA
jgi:hypothetical protein